MGTPCGDGLGTCANLGGSYACTCDPGYMAAPMGGTCLDVNECALGTDDCDEDPDACVNTTGSFRCTCPPGIGGSGRGASGCAGPRFTDLGDGTVRDNNGSGLEWQQSFSPGTQSQAASIAYCTGLALDGGGWRLPTSDELASIVDRTRTPATIDTTFFPRTGPDRFWSSTVTGSASFGWSVLFDTGGYGLSDRTSAYRARCVR